MELLEAASLSHGESPGILVAVASRHVLSVTWLSRELAFELCHEIYPTLIWSHGAVVFECREGSLVETGRPA